MRTMVAGREEGEERMPAPNDDPVGHAPLPPYRFPGRCIVCGRTSDLRVHFCRSCSLAPDAGDHFHRLCPCGHEWVERCS